MSKFLPFNLFVRQALLYPLTAPFLPPVNKVLYGIAYAAGLLTGTYVCPQAFGVPKTGQTIKYVNNDDGDYEKGFPLAPPHYVDNGDGTISDRATGLMWVKDYIALGAPFNAKVNWATAIINCEALNHGGHDDWRMPNIKEMITIVDYSVFGPSVDETFFQNTDWDYHWSSTTVVGDTGNAWVLEGGGVGGTVAPWVEKTSTLFVRPVRLG